MRTVNGHKVMLQAHRGVSTDCPENTMVAFRASVEQGYDWIELDPKFTADNQCVVLHDRYLDRTARTPDGKKPPEKTPIESVTLAEARAYEYGSWHDAAFFNMVRPLELVFSSGMDKGEQIGPKTMDVLEMTSFEQFFDAYKAQQEFFIEMMAQADNAVDAAHAVRCPLPFESCLIDDCIANGKSVQEGGCHYNFTGPQGFGIANVAASLAVMRKLVFEDGVISMAEMKQALADNFGRVPPTSALWS